MSKSLRWHVITIILLNLENAHLKNIVNTYDSIMK